MKLAKLYVLSLSIAAVLAGPSAFAQTATTDPVGFSTVSLPVGSSIVVPTLLNAASFTGNAVISAAGVTPSGAPGWLQDAYAPTNFNDRPNYPTHYVEVVEGTYEGHSFDVLSNSTTALTVGAGEIPAPLVGQTVKVVVRRHITLNDVSNGSSGLSAYADLINLYNENGTTTTRYFDGTSWVADDYTTPAGHTIIYPGTGGFLTTVANAQVVLLGGVKTTKTAIPLYGPGIVNVVGPLNPGAQSLLVSADLAPALAPYQDVINNFSANGSLANTGTYYSDGTGILDGNYAALPPGATDNILGNHGVTIAVGANTYWISKSPMAP